MSAHPSIQDLFETIQPLMQKAEENARERRRAHEEKWSRQENIMRWWEAVQSKDYGAVDALVREGAPIDAVSPAGKTALGYFAHHAHKSLVKLVLSAGADINQACPAYGTALFASLYSGDESITQYLLDRRANPDALAPSGNPIVFEVISARPDRLRCFVDAGVNLDVRDNQGATPLLAACRSGGRAAQAILLLEKGQDINARDSLSLTPLMYAAMSQSVEIAKALLSRGALVNAANKTGSTALMYAISGPRPLSVASVMRELIELLLDHGADPCAVSEKESVLSLASQFAPPDMKDRLSNAAAEKLANTTLPSSAEYEPRRL